MDRYEQLHSDLQQLRDDVVEMNASVNICATRLEEHAKQDATNFERISEQLGGLSKCMDEVRVSLAESRGSSRTWNWIWGAAMALASVALAAVAGCN